MTEERFRTLVFAWGFIFMGLWTTQPTEYHNNKWGILLAWVGLLMVCLHKEEKMKNDN